MKITHVLMPLLVLVLALACSKKPDPNPITEPEVITPEVVYNFDTTAYNTKEPIINISDSGLEGFLVINGYDTDNQVNGKMSKEDINAVSDLYFSYYLNSSDSVLIGRHLYFTEKYQLNQSGKIFPSYIRLKNGTSLQLPIIDLHDVSVLKEFHNLKSFNCLYSSISKLDLEERNQMDLISISTSSDELEIKGVKSVGRLFVTNTDSYDSNASNSPNLNVNLKNIKSVADLRLNGGIDEVIFPETIHLLSLSGFSKNRLIDLTPFPELKELHLSKGPNIEKIIFNKNLSLFSVIECPKVESLDFSALETIVYCQIVKMQGLKKIDVSKFSKINSFQSKENPSLDSILVNKDQSLTLPDNAEYGRFWEKDDWTEWVVKE